MERPRKKHHRNHTAEKSNRQRRVAVYAISRQYTKRQERMEKNPLPDLRRYVLEETGRRSSYSLQRIGWSCMHTVRFKDGR